LGLVLAPPPEASAEERPIVAVFDLEVKGAKLDKGTVDRLTDYLGTLMTTRGFQVVPRSQLRERLAEAKKGSYKACYDQSCQIEVGRELAAQKTLASQVLKIGSQCKVTVNLYDLKKSASEAAGAASRGCREDDVVAALEEALAGMLGQPGAGAAAPAKLPEIKNGMARIPAGEFLMGCSPGDAICRSEEKPAHTVWVAEFWLDATEVTLAAYLGCVKAGKCANLVTGDKCTWGVAGRDQHPVNCVDWHQAKAYCASSGKRLPTEAEWERAARGGTGGPYPGELEAIAWYGGNSGGATHPVGLKQPNAYGLYDMIGNVWEWCADWFGESTYQGSPARSPTGPETGKERVVRGGSWNHGAEFLRVSFRGTAPPTAGAGYFTYGFRCAASAPPGP
jgi:formylglycine-generating enzyme required for sulfatase activity